MDYNPEYVLQLAVLINQLEKKVITLREYDENIELLRKKYNI